MYLLLQIVLFLSITLIVYNYFIYPFFIHVYSKYIADEHEKMISGNDYLPDVTMIIAAYNEEKVIESKIINSLALDYPSAKFELIVISDGSDDNTHEISKSFDSKKIKTMFQPKRQGKSAALNRALEEASGEIVVFSDANNDFSSNAIKELVKHFYDESIGAVTGAKHIYPSDDREASTGDGLYWKYEAIIKKAESKTGSITAAEGEIFAVKKNLLKPINPRNINDDAAITFDIVKSGYRVLYEENARSEEEASIDICDDIDVKVRMTAGGYQTIKNECKYLFPPRNFFSFSFISHKILRWLTPHFMILAFVSNFLLLFYNSYFLIFAFQLLFYFLALIGWLNRTKPNISNIFYVPMYFVVMNYALFLGFLKYVKGDQGVNWKKAKR